jgi:drug/metabolite transporter (DMT)-like permease
MNKSVSSTTRGIQLMLLGAFILPLMDAASKMMGESIASGVTVLARFSFQSLFLLPFVWSTLARPSRQALYLHFWRSLSICFATLCFFTAIQVMPIADSLAIFFVMPLIVTILAPWFLAEAVGWHRIVAVAVGLIGATIIIQPGYGLFGLRTFLPLGTACGFAFYLMLTRKLARNREDKGITPLSMQFYVGILSTLIMMIVLLLMQSSGVAAFELSWPEFWQWRLLLLVGFIAAVGHLVIANAFKHADASILAPFQYFELIGAALLGWWLFDDVPGLSTWIGTIILVCSGLYIFRRERVIHLNLSR